MSDFIDQTFDWPQEDFEVADNNLQWQGIDLDEIIKQYGTPFKINYLPRISENIQKAKRWFNVAMAKVDYKGDITIATAPKAVISTLCCRRH
jgi:arginine decarboxylase